MFIAGDYGFLTHFNGINWFTYESNNNNKIYWSLDFKEDVTVAVGDFGGRVAIIKIGFRD